jgi:hypothetical protein
VRALTGQIVEVPFRGTGWVYLGEASSKRGVDYSSRRLDGEGQTFVFRAVDAGVYELKFYRQDFIRDYIINDMVTVIVEEPPQALSRSGSAAERVVAEPRWPTVAGRSAPGTGDATSEAGEARPATGNAGPAARDATLGTRDAGPAARDAGPTARDVAPTARDAAPATRDAAPGTGNAVSAPQAGPAVPGAAGIAGAVVPGTAVPGGASVTADGATDGGAALGDAESAAAVLPRDTAAEEYLRKAREEYRGERYPQATAILDQFMERFPLGSDEAYWIYAQICEKQGPSRNIRLALDYYRRLVAEYPQSGRYNDARRRIAYLERYYINIQ